MDVMTRIEKSLGTALSRTQLPGCPPLLGQAMQHAVFPRGARIRPRLCLAVAAACGEDAPAVSEAAATAIELLHCASLVHDDLPCFDDAVTRRGKPSVHRAFGEPPAVLAGDALIVLAFQTLAQGAVLAPMRLGKLMMSIGLAIGVPCGIVAGQAWECEPSADLAEYQREKPARRSRSGMCASSATGCSRWSWAGRRSGAAAAGAGSSMASSCWRSWGSTNGVLTMCCSTSSATWFAAGSGCRSRATCARR